MAIVKSGPRARDQGGFGSSELKAINPINISPARQVLVDFAPADGGDVIEAGKRKSCQAAAQINLSSGKTASRDYRIPSRGQNHSPDPPVSTAC